LDPGGRWLRVLKLDKGEFDEDNDAPLYGGTEDVQRGRLRAVYVAAKRPWWVSLSAPLDSPRENVYERWMLLCAWLRRAASLLDSGYAGLPPTPIECEVTFDEIPGETHGRIEPKNAKQIGLLIHISARPGSPLIAIHVDRGFDDGLAQPENLAEHALISA